jgi:hypothetical protein
MENVPKMVSQIRVDHKDRYLSAVFGIVTRRELIAT